MKKRLLFLIAAVLILCPGCDETIRVMFWNIQNGMWSDQGNNYDNFVDYVKSQNPDICVFAEARTIYYTGTKTGMPWTYHYLPDNWKALAKRYGHDYVYVGPVVDNYPQVITSKYPIKNVKRLTGDKNTKIMHGSGWAQITYKDKTLNIVTVHTWPQSYSPEAKTADERKWSTKKNEGCYYRRDELKCICENTILTSKDAANEYWLMCGDFNSRSPYDREAYDPGVIPEEDHLGHEWILENTPLKDIVYETRFQYESSTNGKARFDYIYASPALFSKMVSAGIIRDDFTKPVVDKTTGYYNPSDHLPIIADFKISVDK